MSLGEPINVTKNKSQDSDGDSDSEGNNGDNNGGGGGVGLPVEKEGDSSIPDAQSASSWSETLRELWETVYGLLESLFS